MSTLASRLLRAILIAIAGLPAAAFATDATNVPMSTILAPSYCSSIDGVDYSSQQYFTSASDVTAKTGKTLMSQNGGTCCTAAKPWNGTSCATLVCPAGTENVAGTCQATANSCAAIGMILIGGKCQTAVPTCPNAYIGKTGCPGGAGGCSLQQFTILNGTTVVDAENFYISIDQWSIGSPTTQYYYYSINPANCSFFDGVSTFWITSGGISNPTYGMWYPWIN